MAKDQPGNKDKETRTDSVTSTEKINPRTGLVKGGREGTADEAGPAQYGAEAGDLTGQQSGSGTYATPPASGETF